MCEAWDFVHLWDDTRQNFLKTESFRPRKTLWNTWTFVKFRKIVFPTFVYFHKSYRHSANIRQHLTVFLSYFNNIFLKYFRILQNLMRNYEILWKLMKATIFHDIFSVQSLTFVPFHSIVMYYWYFVIHTVTNEIFLFAIVLFHLQAIWANILPLSKERWYFQYHRYLIPGLYNKNFQICYVW